MELGMIGLGRMGANMTERLIKGGHRVVGFDPKPEARAWVEGKGADSAASLDRLVAGLKAPRILWMMVPAGRITDDTVAALLPLLGVDDVLVDGGNSNYKDTLRRSNAAADKKICYVDCGTSGRVWGLAEGYSMMVGGGEGRWTVDDAIDLHVPAPVLTLSLLERLRSRDTESFSDKLLSAMRNQFGGHEIKKE